MTNLNSDLQKSNASLALSYKVMKVGGTIGLVLIVASFFVGVAQ